MLKTIKRIVHGVTASSNDYHTAYCAIRDLYRLRQGHTSVDEYYNQFDNLQELVSQADDTELMVKEKSKNPQVTDEKVHHGSRPETLW